MRIGRTLPPATAPIYWRDILNGFQGLLRGKDEVSRFSAELKNYFGAKHCFLVSSGRTALTLILQTLHDLYPDRDEVLIPAFTCYSVPSAIVRSGLKIRLCDVDPRTLDFKFQDLSRSIGTTSPNETSRLLAIVSTHLYGAHGDTERVRDLTGCSEVTVIEDAAQAMGDQKGGRKLGTLGDVSFFSLGRGKPISTAEGGIILTSRNDIGNKIDLRIRSLPCYSLPEKVGLIFKAISLCLFSSPTLFWLPKLIPFLRLGETIYDPGFKMRRMSSFQAGLAEGWRTKLDSLNRSRATLTKRWLCLIKVGNISFSKMENGHPMCIRFPIRIEDAKERNDILKMSAQKGLGIMPSYPDSVSQIEALREQFNGRDYPAAKECADQLITLPTHSYVTPKDMEKILELIGNRSCLK